jgi:hypothetical protein
MAKIHIDRVASKYGKSNIRGKKYQALMNEIIQQNTTNIQRAIGRVNHKKFDKALSRLDTETFKTVVPSIDEVLPKASVSSLKSAEQGELITQTLRDRLNRDLRNSLKLYTKKTGELAFIRRRGKLVGTVNPKAIMSMQKAVTKTFKEYSKKDPRIGVPGNVRNIAVTEVRSNIEEIKKQYLNKLIEKNQGLIDVEKEWIQNKGMAKEPRRSHAETHGVKLSWPGKFQIPIYKSIRGKVVKRGIVLADRPYDPKLPLSEKIGCNCELIYRIKRMT